VSEVGLSSLGPHIQDLIEMDFQFLLGAKPADQPFLLDNFMKMDELSLEQNLSIAANGSSPATHTQWNDHLQLNASQGNLVFIRQKRAHLNKDSINFFSTNI